MKPLYPDINTVIKFVSPSKRQVSIPMKRPSPEASHVASKRIKRDFPLSKPSFLLSTRITHDFDAASSSRSNMQLVNRSCDQEISSSLPSTRSPARLSQVVRRVSPVKSPSKSIIGSSNLTEVSQEL